MCDPGSAIEVMKWGVGGGGRCEGPCERAEWGETHKMICCIGR